MLRSFYSRKNSLLPILLFAVCALYQPANAQWIKIGKAFSEYRTEAQYAYFDGTLFVFGGRTSDPKFLRDCITLNTAEPQAWKAKMSMPANRSGGYAAEYNGKIYLVGGIEKFDLTQDGQRYTFNKTVQEYDPDTQTYTQKSPMPYATYGSPGAVIGSKIYLMGGRTQKAGSDTTVGEITKRVQVYDMATDTWTTSTDAPFQDFVPMATSVGNTIYLFGSRTANKPYGYKGTIGDTITWEPIADCPVKLYLSAMGTIGSYVYAAGGINQTDASANKDIFAYNTEDNTWSKLGPQLPESGQAVPVMPSDGSSVYFINGMGCFNTYRLSLTTDVAGPVDERALRMYPNPASDAAVVELPESGLQATVSVLSLLGEEVLTQTTADRQVVLDVRNLPAGMYTVRYTQGNSVLYRPLIVK